MMSPSTYFTPFCASVSARSLEHANGMIVRLGVQRVGKFASGEIGIAAAHQHQVAGKTAVSVERAVGFYRGVETIVRPDQRERGRSGE